MNKAYELLNKEPFEIDEFLQTIGHEELIGVEEERELLLKAQQGEETAVERLTCGKLRFIVSLANQYTKDGHSLQRLIEVGVKGFERAIKEYDTDSQEKFMHFAVTVMRNTIENI